MLQVKIFLLEKFFVLKLLLNLLFDNIVRKDWYRIVRYLTEYWFKSRDFFSCKLKKRK
jgi:hypothetical protein